MPLLNLDNYVESVFQSKIFEADDGIRTSPMQKTRKLDALISAWSSHTLYKEQTVFFHLRPHFPHIWEGKLNLLAFMVFFRIRFSENFLCSIFGLFFLEYSRMSIVLPSGRTQEHFKPETRVVSRFTLRGSFPFGVIASIFESMSIAFREERDLRGVHPVRFRKRGLTCASCVL